MTATVSSSALHWQASPGGCTAGQACEVPPFQSLPTPSCGTCSGSHPAELRPLVVCTWPADQVLLATLWTMGTCACIHSPTERVNCNLIKVPRPPNGALTPDPAVSMTLTTPQILDSSPGSPTSRLWLCLWIRCAVQKDERMVIDAV